VIAVTRAGRRFTNEASSYYDFVCALFGTTPPGDGASGGGSSEPATFAPFVESSAVLT